MRRSIGVAGACTAAALAAGLACGSGSGQDNVAIQRLETELCEKSMECGCPPVPLECGDWPLDDPFIDDPFGNDPFGNDPFGNDDDDPLAFDPACVERWSSWVETLSCETPALPRYADLCPLYHGTLRAGEDCDGRELYITDCGRGLLCIAGQCRDPQQTLVGGTDQPCELGDWCEAGLLCLDEVCRRLPSPGEPCLRGRCQAGAECEQDQCVELPGPGEPCPSLSCRSGARCQLDPSTGERICESLADVGEPCMGHRDCVSGNCPAGFCEDPAEVGDACSNRLPCGPGQLCDLGICRAEGDGLVPTGSACTILGAL